MKYIIFAFTLFAISAGSVASPAGKYANLKKYPDCKVYFNFINGGIVYVPDNGGNRTIKASWKRQGGIIIIQTNLWESHYQYKADEQKLIWSSIKIGKDLRNITKQYALEDRSLSACP